MFSFHAKWFVILKQSMPEARFDVQLMLNNLNILSNHKLIHNPESL